MGIFNGIFYFFSPSCFSQKSQYRYFKNIWLGDVKLVHQYALHKRPATQLHNVCTYMVTLPVGGLHCRVSRKTLKSQQQAHWLMSQQAHRTTATSLVHVLGKQLTAKQTPESTGLDASIGVLSCMPRVDVLDVRVCATRFTGNPIAQSRSPRPAYQYRMTPFSATTLDHAPSKPPCLLTRVSHMLL